MTTHRRSTKKPHVYVIKHDPCWLRGLLKWLGL